MFTKEFIKEAKEFIEKREAEGISIPELVERVEDFLIENGHEPEEAFAIFEFVNNID